MQQPIVILGGTFDPVHNGHLRSAVEVAELLGVAQVRLVPANIPVHRVEPTCTTTQRLQMLKLATENECLLQVDDRECVRGGRSFMVETLESLREEFGHKVPLILILGMDAFMELAGWYQWQRITELAHLLLLERPGSASLDSINHELRELLDSRQVTSRDALLSAPSGQVLTVCLSQLDISASQIRNAVRQGKSVHYLVPEPVWEYIQAHGIYRDSKKGLVND